MEMWIGLVDDSDMFRLPVLPPSIKVTDTMNNTTVNVNTLGEVTLIGNKGLKTISGIDTIFPATRYSWMEVDDLMDPEQYVDKIESYMDKVVRFIATDTNINMLCTIESFEHGLDDATGDISYSLSLKEYKTVKISSYTTKRKHTKTYIVKSGDTLKKIAKKVTGKTSNSKSIYSQNKKVIEKAFKAHQKALKRAGKPQIKSNTSKSGKYIYAKTKLVITYVS